MSAIIRNIPQLFQLVRSCGTCEVDPKWASMKWTSITLTELFLRQPFQNTSASGHCRPGPTGKLCVRSLIEACARQPGST